MSDTEAIAGVALVAGVGVLAYALTHRGPATAPPPAVGCPPGDELGQDAAGNYQCVPRVAPPVVTPPVVTPDGTPLPRKGPGLYRDRSTGYIYVIWVGGPKWHIQGFPGSCHYDPAAIIDVNPGEIAGNPLGGDCCTAPACVPGPMTSGTTPGTCPSGTYWNAGAGACVPPCDAGSHFNGHYCVHDCPTGKRWDEGAAACAPDCGGGYRWNGHSCVVACNPGASLVVTGECPVGYCFGHTLVAGQPQIVCTCAPGSC